jgi:demethylspheroidene O-methyltransferase
LHGPTPREADQKFFCFFFFKKRSLHLLSESLPSSLSLREFVLAWRDRLLADPRFHAFAARFPLTRGVAKREAKALFDICAGFVSALVLGACVELDLFEVLAGGPMEERVLAARVGAPAAGFGALVSAAVSLRLLARAGERVRLGQLGAALRGNPGVAAMIKHHRLFYEDLRDPVALVRGETAPMLAKFWPYDGQAGDFAGYSALMAATQPMIAAEIFGAHDFSRQKCILDVCGGDGSFLVRAAARAPGARLILFDLPEVAARAEAKFAAAGLAGRARAVGGDVSRDALPAGADLVTLIRVLHDNSDARAAGILAAARAALAPGGKILVAEPLSGTAGAQTVGAYFSMYLLAMRSGRPRCAAELRGLLEAAGFRRIRELRTRQPLLASVVTAEV